MAGDMTGLKKSGKEFFQDGEVHDVLLLATIPN
jgi:hypothetical protein